MTKRWGRKSDGPIRGVSMPVRTIAGDLRANPTSAERVLWNALRGKQIAGVRFRRQHAVGRFVLDFYAPACHLVIELDGRAHDRRTVYDDERSRMLAEHGFRVLRFTNDEVLWNLTVVLDRIRAAATIE